MRAWGRQSGFVVDAQAIYPFSRLFCDGCHSRLPRSAASKREIEGPWVTACSAYPKPQLSGRCGRANSPTHWFLSILLNLNKTSSLIILGCLRQY